MYLRTLALKKSFGLIFKKKIGKEIAYFSLVLIGIALITALLLSFNRVWFASQPLSLVNVSLVKGHRISITEISASYSSNLVGYNILVTGKTTGDIVESHLILFSHNKPGSFKQKTVTVVNNDGTFQARHDVPEELKSYFGWIVTWSIKDGKVVATSNGNFRNFVRY
jgi:hypothetical protein